MKVNVISESAFTVQGHGVHTAFTETVDMLESFTDWQVEANGREPADVVHLHTIGLYALGKLVFSPGAKVISAHVTPDSFVGSLIGAKYWRGLAKAYLRWFYNRADAVLAVSGEVVEELKTMGVSKPVYLVPNTIKTAAFAPDAARRQAAREQLGIAPDAFVVLSNGQVQPRKRIDVFVAAARALPATTFIWVGGVPFKKLAAESEAMGELMKHPPANVRFSGVVPRGDVMKYYQAADLFFLPSDQETFGIVIVEAAAAGLPVLLRDLEQYRQTFEPGYERGDDNSFINSIKRFQSDREYYEQWQTASKIIAQRYDAQNGAAKLVEVYQKVIQSKNGS